MAQRLLESVQDVLAERYGLRCTTRESPAALEVNIAIGLILPMNPCRLSLIMVNLSANNVWISPDTFVDASHGIQLVPNGGSFILNYREDLILASKAWYACAAANNSDFYWLEVTLY